MQFTEKCEITFVKNKFKLLKFHPEQLVIDSLVHRQQPGSDHFILRTSEESINKYREA